MKNGYRKKIIGTSVFVLSMLLCLLMVSTFAQASIIQRQPGTINVNDRIGHGYGGGVPPEISDLRAYIRGIVLDLRENMQDLRERLRQIPGFVRQNNQTTDAVQEKVSGADIR